MTVKELKELIKDLPDDTEVEANAIWDDNKQELTPSPINDAFYHKKDNKVYMTPEIISMP